MKLITALLVCSLLIPGRAFATGYALTLNPGDTISIKMSTPPATTSPTPTVTPGPTVTLTSPSNGATVSGTTNLTVVSSGAISWVNFNIDGNYLASSPPYTIAWDTTKVANGTHTVSVVAYATAGSPLVASASEIVSVLNPTPTPSPSPSPTPSPTPTPFPVAVNAITTSPIMPKVGDHVIFSATVQNVSASPALVGTVQFAIDSKVVAWSDNPTLSLAPGQIATVTSNNGPNGTPYWVATQTVVMRRGLLDAMPVSKHNWPYR
jgi:hypothetical protein